MAVSIDRDGLATEAADAISPLLDPENSWRVMLEPNCDLCWESDTTTLHRQPARSGWQRLADFVLGMLPLRRYV
jgi:hypothetical protein